MNEIFKYNEDKILDELEEYIKGTYQEHYNNDGVDCFSLWIGLGDVVPTFRNTALKYLSRYGKKEGNNKKDLYKALHYILLMINEDFYKKSINKQSQINSKIYSLNALANDIHLKENAKWWDNPNSSKERRLLLIHSEVSEAAEGVRKNKMSDKLPGRTLEEEEFADILIRTLDYMVGYGMDIDSLVREKRAYNANRQDHIKEAAESKNGDTWK
jgi:NTP pyrophosphatase (non-canonical NTP hydrolase)